MNLANQLQTSSHPLAAAARVFKGGGSDVAPRDIYTETSGELRAKLDLAPSLLAAEQEFRPQYGALELQQLEHLLFGIRGTRTTPAQRGFVDILGALGPLSDQFTAQSLSRQREAEVADVERLGSRATEAYRQANPQQAALLSSLNRQVLEELQLGAVLDPSLRREVALSVRTGQAARGLGTGRDTVSGETLFAGLAAEQLRGQRKGVASGLVGLNQATIVDPFLTTLGRPAINLDQSSNLIGSNYGRPLGAALFGSSIDANDIFSSNFNARVSAANAAANNRAALQAAALSGVGTAAGTGLTGYALAADPTDETMLAIAL